MINIITGCADQVTTLQVKVTYSCQMFQVNIFLSVTFIGLKTAQMITFSDIVSSKNMYLFDYPISAVAGDKAVLQIAMLI